MAQLAEQLICNQQVIGSSPIIGLHQTVNLNDVCWKTVKLHMGGFPSGQRGQTVNLLQFASVVRIPDVSLLKRLEVLKNQHFRFFYAVLSGLTVGWIKMPAKSNLLNF